MELKDFVSETLKQIIEGVKAAQEQTGQMGGKVSPSLIANPDLVGVVTEKQQQPVQMVEFDVAVTEATGKGSKAGIGVFFGAIGAGAQGESQSSSTAMNRIKFSVPLLLPTGR